MSEELDLNGDEEDLPDIRVQSVEISAGKCASVTFAVKMKYAEPFTITVPREDIFPESNLSSIVSDSYHIIQRGFEILDKRIGIILAGKKQR